MFVKNLLINFIADLILGLALYSAGYEGGLTLNGVTKAAGSLFGGIPSLIGIVGVLAVLALFWFAIRYLAYRNLNGWAATAGVVVGFFIAASFGLWKFVSMPDGNLWLLVGFIIFVAVHTVAITWPGTRRRQTTIPVTEEGTEE